MHISRRNHVVFGVALFFIGTLTWLIVGPLLVVLVTDAQWIKNVALVAFAIPLSIAAWREHRQGRTRRIVYLVAGWLLASVVVGGGLYLVLYAIGPVPRG